MPEKFKFSSIYTKCFRIIKIIFLKSLYIKIKSLKNTFDFVSMDYRLLLRHHVWTKITIHNATIFFPSSDVIHENLNSKYYVYEDLLKFKYSYG